MTTRNMMRRTSTFLHQGIRVFLCLALLSQVSGGAEYFYSDNHHQFPASDSPLWMGDFNANSLSGQSIDENGFIFIKDGHFHNKSGRVRFFGLNMTHALFSPKEDAVEMARQLEGLGVNLLRAHYMDFIDIWGGSFRLFGDPRYNYEDFDEEQLDRVDFFFSELKKRGIYVYLDFHSGWHYRNTDTYRMKEYTQQGLVANGKGVDTFVPELIEQQKWYTERIMNHVNPYTGLAYKDDPLFAMMEINNENAFYRCMLTYADKTDKLPQVFRDALQTLWQEYLEEQYGNVDRLNEDWSTEYAGFHSVKIPDSFKTFRSDPAQFRQQYRRAFYEFAYEIDRRYASEMVDFIKGTIGVRVPLTFTQVDYSFLRISAEYSDFIDTHAYWCYPHAKPAPGKSFLDASVQFGNYSIVPFSQGIFGKINSYRVEGKPYVISEIDIPSANDYGGEAPLIQTLNSTLQDHDAIIIYAYKMRPEHKRYMIFSLANDFVKLSQYPLAASIFRGCNVAPLRPSVTYEIGLDEEMETALRSGFYTHPLLSKHYQTVEKDFSEVPVDVLRHARVYVKSKEGASLYPSDKELEVAEDERFRWFSEKSTPMKSYWRFEDSGYNLFAGFTIRLDQCRFRKAELRGVRSGNHHLVFALTNLDGPIGAKGRHVVNLLNKRKYQGYDYTSSGEDVNDIEDRNRMRILITSVEPEKKEFVEALQGQLILKLDKAIRESQVSVYPMDNAGTVRRDTPVEFSVDGTRLTVQFKPEYHSILYLIDVK